MSRRLALALALALSTGPRALAQPVPPADPTPAPAGALEQAKFHFQQGVALFNDGAHSGALAEFLEAYRLHPSPGVLYNIALTQKAMLRYAEAIASLERYLAEGATLAPERRAEAQQLVREMRALLADVTLDIIPAGATLLVDGRALGHAPLPGPLQLAAGLHVLEVQAEGHKPARREIMVTAGVPLALTLHLEAIPRTGKVTITSNKPLALVHVDGRMRGYAPLELELGAGGHQLEVFAPKQQPYRSELVVAAGQARAIAVELTAPPSRFYKKWYFWTPLVGGAAVALGVGLGVFYSLKSRDVVIGSLDPGATAVPGGPTGGALTAGR